MTKPECTAGGIDLGAMPVMIGAGACKTPGATKKWLQVAATVSGSYTPEARASNDGSRLFWPDDLDTLLAGGKAYNWFGMPNIGIPVLTGAFINRQDDNSLIISIAAFSVDDYIESILQVAKLESVAAIELNFGCQNTEHGEPLSFEVHCLKELFEKLPHIEIPIWIKLSPYLAEKSFLLPTVAKLINKHCSRVAAVVTCNTKWEYAGKDKISSPDGFASLSGPALAEISKEQLQRFRACLHEDIDVISVGGIMTGQDIVERLNLGAAAVQLTTLPYLLGKPDTFLGRILEDGALLSYLAANDYL